MFTLSNLGTHHLDARVLALLQLAETLLLLQLLLLLNVARNGQIELRDAVLQLASLLELGLGFGAGLRRCESVTDAATTVAAQHTLATTFFSASAATEARACRKRRSK